MALSHPVKVVLKSTTTQTLSDRFTEMMRNKSPAKNHNTREEMTSNSRASVKNRRLAEQMSRRPGGQAMMDKIKKESVKDRIDQSKVKSDVRDRLGIPGKRGGGIQNRLGRGGTVREGRGRGNFRGRGGRGAQNFRSNTTFASPRGNRNFRGNFGNRDSRNSFRDNNANTNRSRGATRGRNQRGRGQRGGRGRRPVDRSYLDNELDSYMTNS